MWMPMSATSSSPMLVLDTSRDTSRGTEPIPMNAPVVTPALPKSVLWSAAAKYGCVNRNIDRFGVLSGKPPTAGNGKCGDRICVGRPDIASHAIPRCLRKTLHITAGGVAVFSIWEEQQPKVRSASSCALSAQHDSRDSWPSRAINRGRGVNSSRNWDWR